MFCSPESVTCEMSNPVDFWVWSGSGLMLGMAVFRVRVLGAGQPIAEVYTCLWLLFFFFCLKGSVELGMATS